MSKRSSPKPAAQPVPSSALATKLSNSAVRWERWGGVAITVWYLGGFALLMLLMLLEVGPTVWVSGWLNRHFGSDSVTVAFLPGFAILALPVLILQLLPRQVDRPFIRGAQYALAPSRNPDRVVTSTADLATFLLRAARIAFVVSALFVVAGAGAYGYLMRSSPDTGKPLPRMTVEQILDHRNALPPYVRLIGVAPGYRPSWVHQWTLRRASYDDLYFPLDGDARRDGARTHIVGLVSTVLGYGDDPGARRVMPTEIDGSIRLISLPGWQRLRMAEKGFTVTDPVIVLTQDTDLQGKYPGGDTIGAEVLLGLGLLMATVTSVIAMIFLVRRRRLLRSAVAEPRKARHDRPR